MSQKAVEQLIGRLITDSRFRKKAARSLEAACIEEGYELTESERRIIASLDLDWLARAGCFWVDGEICRYSPETEH